MISRVIAVIWDVCKLSHHPSPDLDGAVLIVLRRPDYRASRKIPHPPKWGKYGACRNLASAGGLVCPSPAFGAGFTYHADGIYAVQQGHKKGSKENTRTTGLTSGQSEGNKKPF